MNKTLCVPLLIALLGINRPVMAQPAPSTDVIREVFGFINQARARPCRCGSKKYSAVAPLVYNQKLAMAAQNHANWMVSSRKMSHTEPKREVANAWDRISQQGYGWSSVAENIAAGQMTAREVVDGWVRSPDHCKNLMDGSVKEIGIGLATTTRGQYHYYWVTDFAAPR